MQHDFANKRIALGAESTEQYGFAVKGAAAVALSRRAAVGVIGGAGAGHQD
ncbi:MAG: hypothetical protein H0W08_09210, partial [Acidobacteria bacterium]|nr:hypothetical protein [Acidobacteriota bacterium]